MIDIKHQSVLPQDGKERRYPHPIYFYFTREGDDRRDEGLQPHNYVVCPLCGLLIHDEYLEDNDGQTFYVITRSKTHILHYANYKRAYGVICQED